MAQKKIIYFDHAATSYPKPEIVYRALDENFRRAGNAGRGAYALALDSARTIFESRLSIAKYLGINRSEQLIFTPGCTYSINMAIHSWLSIRRRNGESAVPNVLVSSLEHNAVMRPLHALFEQKQIRLHHLPYKTGSIIDTEDLNIQIKTNRPDLLVLQHGNNVTGEVCDLGAIVKLCREAGLGLVIDAAQTAGTAMERLLDLNHDPKYGAIYWCASGHKGLMGPPGIGLLYTNASEADSLIMGGTGSGSESYAMPSHLPDSMEPGTMPMHQVAALAAAVNWLGQQDLNATLEKELRLLNKFQEWALSQNDIEITPHDSRDAKPSSANRLPIISFGIKGMTPDRVADLLDREFAIAVRSGLHCNAATHATLGTVKSGGLTRLSLGPNNSEEDVAALCEALSSLKKKLSNWR
jgi:cysteine desulfurase / selenocysteine lyase